MGGLPTWIPHRTINAPSPPKSRHRGFRKDMWGGIYFPKFISIRKIGKGGKNSNFHPSFYYLLNQMYATFICTILLFKHFISVSSIFNHKWLGIWRNLMKIHLWMKNKKKQWKKNILSPVSRLLWPCFDPYHLQKAHCLPGLHAVPNRPLFQKISASGLII